MASAKCLRRRIHRKRNIHSLTKPIRQPPYVNEPCTPWRQRHLVAGETFAFEPCASETLSQTNTSSLTKPYVAEPIIAIMKHACKPHPRFWGMASALTMLRKRNGFDDETSRNEDSVPKKWSAKSADQLRGGVMGTNAYNRMSVS